MEEISNLKASLPCPDNYAQRLTTILLEKTILVKMSFNDSFLILSPLGLTDKSSVVLVSSD